MGQGGRRLTGARAAYPIALSRNSKGVCVVAVEDLEPGAVVERFDGPEVPYDQVPDEEVGYVISFRAYLWVIPRTPARYLNHSCDPNCQVRPTREVVTLRRVARGEELTISYDWADLADYRAHPDHYFWDPRWTFECHCRSGRCLARIDHYRPV